jgi:ADP-ribose pyrophosphatase YjhB (NUDIX family)
MATPKMATPKMAKGRLAIMEGRFAVWNLPQNGARFRLENLLGEAMKREYPDRPLLGVGAVVIEDGRALLVRRGHAPQLGEWSIPGGLVELSETVRQAAVREVSEETGLTIEPLELIGVFDRIVADGEGRTLYHYVLIDFLCRRVAGELQAADDADEARWFTWEQVEGLQLPRDTAEAIRRGFQSER